MTLPSYFSIPDTLDCAQLKTQAEELFNSGQFYCSEVVVKIIRDTFCPSVSDEIIAAASGFPVGMGGGGCTCGAVAGGVMALGLIFGRTRPGEKVQSAECMKYARELHDRFRKENKSVCCRVLTKNMLADSPEHTKQCAELTGEVVEIVTGIILREAKAP
ncbi:C-GCAxxG-C-C family (seleno)protein [Methanocorpusculum vombati]|uniref:C-GCAxxG-C-C family protein n=1 Tax=Methanocorpusculum vombati TaxID=3002864 RepID=A0ABT4IMI0_9EURY|nr:C-GCAxxG-C-C family (seleno)protein [Methanocorpusculum vombati]MCZ9311976.1 C-GCAxxG-C-C family protein [Methanocorpusculum sp.]MCZ0862534.1 C-GCAxxG-C-C family protein [Methanocorpusculum vombati]MCZ9318797.1 C-GCAxxG-C-C family protein [Methanocorpusculum sp.]MDE2521439.1 C-GCAxxG-C-C family protein [Methanocorpusculum sp.]MDE2533925.1 C-GCAxxG-C-C family protein [Methanocorpusculum sp.]